MEESHRIVVVKVRKALKQIEPERLVQHMEDLRAQNGGLLTTEQLVDAARAPGSVLHDCFTWDDGEAAERYRKLEAATIVRAVRIYDEHHEVGRKYEAVRVYTDDGGKRRGYMERSEVAENETLRKQVLKTALSQMMAMKRRFKNLAEMGKVWEALQDAVEAHGLEDLL